MTASPFDVHDMRIESVTEDGEVRLRFPSGRSMTFSISREMVPYYRRLVQPPQPPAN